MDKQVQSGVQNQRVKGGSVDCEENVGRRGINRNL